MKKKILPYLYNNWAYTGIILAFYITLILIAFYPMMSPPLFWVWLQFPLYLLHEFEEHAYPGGFQIYVNKQIFQSSREDFPLNPATIFWINIPFIWITFPLFALLSQYVHPSFGAVLPYFALFNATVHILSFLIKQKYNPGFLVSFFLNYPFGLYALYTLDQENLLSCQVHVLSFLFALISHLVLIGYALYRYKTKA